MLILNKYIKNFLIEEFQCLKLIQIFMEIMQDAIIHY